LGSEGEMLLTACPARDGGFGTPDRKSCATRRPSSSSIGTVQRDNAPSRLLRAGGGRRIDACSFRHAAPRPTASFDHLVKCWRALRAEVTQRLMRVTPVMTRALA